MRLAIQDRPTRERLAAVAADALDILAVHAGQGAGNAGTALGPSELARRGIAAVLERAGHASRWQDIRGAAGPHNDEEARFRDIYRVSRALADATEASAGAGRRFLVLGGDHAIATGTWAGAANALGSPAELGLVWIDAHLDAHTPATSPSGNWHGMPLAHLLGMGRPELVLLARGGRAVLPANVVIVGARSFEHEERAFLARLGVRVIAVEEIARHGLSTALDEAFAIAGRATARHGISVDIDVVDPAEAPGTGTPAAGGLAGADLVAALRGRAADPRCLGLEVVEYNPVLDDAAGSTAALVEALIASALEAEPQS
jgi:arginase